jgi:probable F420-dependent oxidoreductase
MPSTTLLTRPNPLELFDWAEQTAAPCGIAIPQSFVDGRIDTELIEEFVPRAEDLGYHSLWTGESILGASDSLEPIGLLSYVAALTESIRLGTAVVIATNRNPVQLAKAFGTLDQLSNGRLIVGMAIGGDPGRYPLFGAPSERRVRHFVEGLEVMKALWQQPQASYDGHFYTLDGETMEPKPVQKPHPPVWLGGRHPDALRRAVRHADGWMGAGGTSTEQFRAHVEIVRESLADSGRDPASFTIAKRVYLAIDDDADRAERRLRDWFGLTYGSQDMGSRVSVWGSVSRCIEGVSEVVEAGAQMLLLNPVFDEMMHLEALHDEVIPNLPRP